MTHRTLIIPDIHHKHQIAEKIITKEQPDLTIFLGDYFDDFGDNPNVANKTAKWLVESLEHDATYTKHDNSQKSNQRIHLIGNHDLHYMTNNNNFWCSGYTEQKHHAINAHKIDWSKLKLHYWLYNQDKNEKNSNYNNNPSDNSNNTHNKEKGWLCTHAGFSNKLFIQQRKTNAETITKVLQRADKDLLNAHNKTIKHPFLQAGFLRGGPNNSIGGLVWCDYAEFEDIPNTRQIFGHTRDYKVRHKSTITTDSEHYCIDTVLCNYAICENYNTMTIKNTNEQIL